MKTLSLKILMLTLLLTSVLSYSQDLQPKKIQYKGIDGLFISFALMDSVSVKLIDRKSLLTENYTFSEIYKKLELENNELRLKFDLSQSQAFKYKSLFDITLEQKEKALENFESQKIITSNVKAKARRNGLLYFGGGLVIGVTVFAVLVN